MPAITIIDTTAGQTLRGQLGAERQHSYAIIGKGRGQWWPVLWDGVECYDLDTEPQTKRDALATASDAYREHARDESEEKAHAKWEAEQDEEDAICEELVRQHSKLTIDDLETELSLLGETGSARIVGAELYVQREENCSPAWKGSLEDPDAAREHLREYETR